MKIVIADTGAMPSPITEAIEQLRHMMTHSGQYRNPADSARRVLRNVTGDSRLIAKIRRDSVWERLVSVFRSKFRIDLDNMLDGKGGGGGLFSSGKKRKGLVATAYSDDSPSATKIGFNDSGETKRVAEATQYLRVGNLYKPMGPATLVKALPAGVYAASLDDYGKAVFEVRNVRSDDLLKFKDSRYNAVSKEIEDFWTLAGSFQEHGYTHKRGVLMHGDPGTGKSCIIKQVMIEALAKDVAVVFPTNMWTFARILDQLRDVESSRNVLAVLEDVDEQPEKPVLELFDGDRQFDNVLFLATTNYLDRLPQRITRAGRFDRKLPIKNPPREGRMAYYGAKLKNTVADAELERMVDVTDDFSFAQMREFVIATRIFKEPLKDAAQRIRAGNKAEASGGQHKHGPKAWAERVGDNGRLQMTRATALKKYPQFASSSFRTA